MEEEMKKSDNDVEELNCPICLMEITNDNDAVLDCKHQFHVDCIKQWSMVRACCPLCKGPFTRISFGGQILLIERKKRKRTLHSELFDEDDDDNEEEDDDDEDDENDNDEEDDEIGFCIVCLDVCGVEPYGFVGICNRGAIRFELNHC